jgi:hypothetical protein
MEAPPRNWCPLCEPDVDQTTEYVVEERCAAHRVDPTEGFHVAISDAAGGETNRKFCDLLHRRKDSAD